MIPSKTKWERFLVYIMGPAMNLLLGVVTAALLYQGAESPTYEQEPLIVGAVIKDLAGGARAGQIGDRIVTVAGREMRTWISSSSRSVPERTARRRSSSTAAAGARRSR